MYGFDFTGILFSTFFVVNSDWFRFPAATPSSSGPKYSLNRVISDGHVVRVLLAHQECLLYGRVHWAGADLQIRGSWGGGGGLTGFATGVSYYF